jgi:L-amino acid N-acyltransferase YncA
MRNRLWRDRDMSVRPARIEDAPQIARVHVDTWRATYSGIVPEVFLVAMSYEDFEGRWRNWLEGELGVRACFYVAESPAGRIVGFASGGPRQDESYPQYESELYTAYLLPQHQGQGLGRQLLGAVGEGLLVNGKRSILTWVLAENPSRRFYEAVGGKLVGSQEIEIGGVGLEEVAYGWNDICILVSSAWWVMFKYTKIL